MNRVYYVNVMMKELVENIESEIADLKKTMNRWDEIGDASLLKVAQRNIAHAQDWMSLLNEILIKKSQNVEQKSGPIMPHVEVNQSAAVTEKTEEVNIPQPKPSVGKEDALDLNEEKITISEEKPEEIVEVQQEENISSLESIEEVSAVQKNEDEAMTSCTVSSEVVFSQSISTTSTHTTEEQGKTVIQESREHRSILSQSFEEKAKKIDRKEDLIKETSILGDHLLKMEKGIYASLSLNDIFRFSREWFDGNSKQLEFFLKQIEESPSFEEAVALIQRTLPVNEESESWDDLTEVIEKYFKG